MELHLPYLGPRVKYESRSTQSPPWSKTNPWETLVDCAGFAIFRTHIWVLLWSGERMIYIYTHIHRYISVFHGLTPFLQQTYRFLRWILTSDFMGELPTTQRALKGVVGYQWNHTVWHRAQVNRTSVATRLACNVHNMGACLYVGGRSLKTGSKLLMKKGMAGLNII